MLRRERLQRTRLGRHALVGQLAPGVFVFVEIEAHCMQYMRRLGELNIGVLDDLDAVSPGVEKIEERSGQEPSARRLDPRAHARAVIDDKAEMPALVFVASFGFHQVDELVAELDESIARAFSPKREIEDLGVKFESLVDIADFEGDVIDADEPRLARVRVADLGHALPSSWFVRYALPIY